MAFPLTTIVKEYKFDAGNIHALELRGSVGSFNAIHTDTNKVSVVVEIRSTNHHWWKRDVYPDSVELHDQKRGDHLLLEQTDEDLNIDWTVEVLISAVTSATRAPHRPE